MKRITRGGSSGGPVCRRAGALVLVSVVAAAVACAGPALARPRHARGAPDRTAPQRGELRRGELRAVALTRPERDASPRPLRWLEGRLPPGGALAGGSVVHAIREGETWASIAEAYLELTNVYAPAELASAIVKENLPASKAGPKPGLRVRIPSVLVAAPRSGAGARLGLPGDGVVRGIYVRGSTAGARTFPALLDRAARHGVNAIVLDVKDYDGALTYPSKVTLAVESGAAKKPPMRSYARAVRFAHERGLSVIARVSCFNDQLMAKAHPSMAIRGVSGHVYRNGWLDPRSEGAQGYVMDLVKEAIAAGVDEIQLDYVRFPVIGMKNIDFGLDTRKDPDAKIDVITRFAERVHALTRAHGVPLALDVFGVIAFGKRVDMRNLGQDPAELAKHAESLNPMVYPSHYEPGFMGLDEPGDHPELVGLGVKYMRSEIEERGGSEGAKIRPWLQAMGYKSPSYGPAYIQQEIRSGDRAGAQGWLLWNPGQIYDVAWRALPPTASAEAAARKGATVSKR